MHIIKPLFSSESFSFNADAFRALSPRFSLIADSVISGYFVKMAINALFLFRRMHRSMFTFGFCFQMVRVYAALVQALVMNVMAFWNWAYERFIGENMSAHQIGMRLSKLPVSSSAKGCNPLPASGLFVYFVFLTESFNRISFGRHNVKASAPEVVPLRREGAKQPGRKQIQCWDCSASTICMCPH